MRTIAIVLNSPSPLPEIEENEVLCADAGYLKIVGVEKNVIVIGDFDSLGTVPKNVTTITCPVEKDYTDGERAIRYAAEKGYEKVTVYGADGGRMDMQFANLLLLKIAYDLHLKAEIVTLKERVFYVENSFSFSCDKGKTVSVIPHGGEAVFTSSSGLYYSLDGVRLTPSDTVGLSNKTTERTFSFSIKKGGAFVFIER